MKLGSGLVFLNPMNNKPEYNRDQKEVTEAGLIAKFYGFKSIISPTIIKQDFEFVKNFDQTSHPAEKVALLRTYFEEKMMAASQPVMLYCEKPFPGSKEKKKPLRLESSIISLGSAECVCECLAIQTGITILNAIGYKNLEVHLNSIGDKDSANEFQKNLTLFIRKNINSFPTDLRQAIKKDIFAILKESKEEWRSFQSECPKLIDFLSESSRLHFKEVLEFLEIMDIPYTIDHHLLGDADIGSETIFSINSEDNGELASGLRFNRLAKKIGYKKELPCNILHISAKLKKNLKKIKVKITKPQFYLVQFGREAKLQSFLVLKELYKAKVSVMHAIDKDKLSDQMNIAESSGAPYIILIGQKEALANSVVIRNTISRSQEIVPISDLANRVKELI